MKVILIGHRGAGKTNLLQRILIYNAMSESEIPLFDLDREIEKLAQNNITEIFNLIGENSFRKMEISLFEKLARFKNYVISVGAGFQLSEINLPEDVQIVWVRRKSDTFGRIFLNRPRLDATLRPLDEYQARFNSREQAYAKSAHWVYEIPEGLSGPSEIEKQIFNNTLDNVGGGLTILPEHAQNFNIFKERQWRWEFSFFELRDDLLTDEQIEMFLAILPKDQVLLSFRKSPASAKMIEAARAGYKFDCALEIKHDLTEKWLWAEAEVVSIHHRDDEETLESVISRLNENAVADQHLKLAVEIQNFAELEIGLKWHAESPHTRSFLPRSKTGRWSWVRLWLKGRQILNFVREGTGSALDQPSLMEWLLAVSGASKFAAVLGSPVWQSYSPSEHREFFKNKSMPFFAIEIFPEEFQGAMQVLQKMGMVASAVTSPHKKVAYEFVKGNATDLTHELKSANTMIKMENGWLADNTDLEGFAALIDSAQPSDPIVIWGGGGTLPMIQKLLPLAMHISSRTLPEELPKDKIKTLIWAASPNAALPPDEWKPDLVVDLNYRDDSFAKEYCQRTGARYMSGLEMFYTQAQAQQNFWEKYL